MTKFGETLSSATTFTKVHETDEVCGDSGTFYFFDLIQSTIRVLMEHLFDVHDVLS